MSIVHPSLFHIFKKYPNRRDELRGLFKTNESFKSICDDYLQCSEVLNYWNNSSENEAPIRRHEYEQILLDLESEIELFLLKTG
jgi:hypothetical protein